MRIDVITLFPEMIENLASHGVLGRAIEQSILELHTWNPRDYAQDVHRTVDDRPYGGGPGMVMKVEPLKAAVEDAQQAAGKSAKVIYLSPQGKTLQQKAVVNLATYQSLILIAGRYEGIDERLMEEVVDEEWSIGDYVLSGGELAALVLTDAIARMLPGTLGDEQSAEQDSFMNGLLDCPHYTRPECWQQKAVPEVLLSGNHKAIEQWRRKQSLGRTWERRKDLLDELELSESDAQLLKQYLQEHDLSVE